MASDIYQYSELRFLVRKQTPGRGFFSTSDSAHHNEIWDFIETLKHWHLDESQYSNYMRLEFKDTEVGKAEAMRFKLKFEMGRPMNPLLWFEMDKINPITVPSTADYIIGIEEK